MGPDAWGLLWQVRAARGKGQEERTAAQLPRACQSRHQLPCPAAHNTCSTASPLPALSCTGWPPPSRHNTAAPTCRQRWQGWRPAARRLCRLAPAVRWRSCARRRGQRSWQRQHPRCLEACASCCAPRRVSGWLLSGLGRCCRGWAGTVGGWAGAGRAGQVLAGLGKCWQGWVAGANCAMLLGSLKGDERGCFRADAHPIVLSCCLAPLPRPCLAAAEEILHLVLETLTAAVKAAPEAAPEWEQHISGGWLPAGVSTGFRWQLRQHASRLQQPSACWHGLHRLHICLSPCRSFTCPTTVPRNRAGPAGVGGQCGRSPAVH